MNYLFLLFLFSLYTNYPHLLFKTIKKKKKYNQALRCNMLTHPISASIPFSQKSVAAAWDWFWASLIYCWFSTNVTLLQTLWTVIFLCISPLKWPQSVMKVFLNNFLENDTCSLNPYITHLKEHWVSNAEGYAGQNPKFNICRCRKKILYKGLQYFI